MPRTISEHGLIGDMRSAALVGDDGAIDWFCPGRFDAPSVFGAILDPERGGHWRIGPIDPDATSRQFYLPDTNVLVTRFATAGGVVEVWDAMIVERARDPHHRQRLVRNVVGVRGTVEMRFEFAPQFDYGRRPHHVATSDDGAVFADEETRLSLQTPLALDIVDGTAVAELTVSVGEECESVLIVGSPADEPDAPVGPTRPLVDATVRFWQTWLGQSHYRGRWREAVHRSALVLKLLTHEPSGAVIAAPTTSLPEVIGGERNWDYRHVWVRDAAFSMYALLRLGFVDEARGFIGWLMDRLEDRAHCDDGMGPLRSMYDIDGNTTSGEFTLDHWRGHRDSAPVRVRNDAADQLQLDVYGELIDSVYLYDKHSDGIGYDDWVKLTGAADWLAENWGRPDEGIWETRGGQQLHTYSRVMSWVAFERLIRMARSRGLSGDQTMWMRVKDEIASEVFSDGWNAELGAFTQYARSDVLDASLLLMPAVKFVSPSDPRFRSTLAAIEAELVTDTLVFRYHAARSPDGLDGEEGTFSMCSFWYVEALTRTGRLDEAKLALEKMFTYANPLGLYAEEVGLDGAQLGNFPQAFTHFSLISAAVNLDRAIG